MNKDEKAAQVADLTDKLKRAKAALVANFSGLNVAAAMDIRRQLRNAGVEYKVVKNTLMKRALEGTKRAKLSDVFTGTTAVAFKYDDEIGKLGKAARDLT